ncbi:MAG TPA: hypothetical protein VFF73_11900 [Planctomycetota bacterium]|nr:hypothetical protein [Planctomycetota bacterium]
MFPPWITVPAAALHFLAIELGMQALAGAGVLVLSWRSVVGVLGVLGFQLALRVQDELKDVESDLRLAAEGDPRVQGRPLVTGAVQVRDLIFLRVVSLVGVLAAGIALGHDALVASLVVGGLVIASFHWFFVPSMKERLLLAFVTHNPLAAAISAWCVAASTPEVATVSPLVGVLIVAVWAPVAAWEIARKVRLPRDETSYVTYSKVLGWKTAAVLPLLLVGVSAAAFIFLAPRVGLGVSFVATISAGAVVVLLRSILLVAFPTTARANLRPWVELYTGLGGAAFVAELVWRHGART